MADDFVIAKMSYERDKSERTCALPARKHACSRD